MPVFLFTDIENSTQLWEKHSQAMGPALARHDTVLQELVGRYDGRILRHRGDGISAIFEGGAPLECAIAVQKQFTSEDWGEIGSLRLRLALHAGEAERREFTSATIGQKEEYFGQVLNRTARILEAGWGGQILLTPEVVITCPLPNGASLQDWGVHLLKNLEAPQQIYGLLHPDLPLQTFPPLNSLARMATPPPPCPYRGLFAFREEDAPFFFGREIFTKRLVEIVHQRPMVAVIGPSGSGKSSVVFAGLLAHLRQEGARQRPQSHSWLITPFRPGNRPFYALAAALIPLLEPQLNETDRLVETHKLEEALRLRLLPLLDVVGRILQKSPDVNRLLLVADQFEDLYTLCPEPEVRRHFLDVLTEVVAGYNGRGKSASGFVLTLRADFMGQALAHRPFADALQDADVKLGPMTRQELGRAIEKPAQRQGVAFETGLVERILDDVGTEPGNLPLLEFALALLWERQTLGQLTHQAYETIGRVAGALARYADEVYTELSQAQQVQARRLFVQMVRPGEGTEDTRRLATRLELGEANWALVQRLADARLVVASRDPAGQETAEVVHEALTQSWEKLRVWMEADRAFRLWQERLRVALRQWEASQRDEGALLRGALLTEAEAWTKIRIDDLNAQEREFLQASLALRDQRLLEAEAQRQRELAQAQALAEAQQRRAEAERQRAETQAKASRRLRGLAIGLAVVFLVAVGAAIMAIGQRNQAEQHAQLALIRQLAAQAILYASGQPDLAILLGIEANRRSEAAPAKNELLLNPKHSLNLATFLHGHTDGVLSVAFSPDGQTLASGSRDNTIILWNVATGQPLGPPMIGSALTGAAGNVWSVAFSPDGQVLASSGDDGTVILWDAAIRRPLDPPLTGHAGDKYVLNVTFSPDGRLLASAGEDNVIILWDVSNRHKINLPLANYTGTVRSIAFSPNSQTLASTSDHDIMLWDVSTAFNGGAGVIQPLGSSFTTPHLVSQVAFSPNGQTLATGGNDGDIILWDVATGKRLGSPLTGHTELVTSLAFSPDGQILASGSGDNTIRLWDVATGQPFGPPLTAPEWVSSVAFSPDGQMLASGIDNKTIILWKVAARQYLIGHKEWVDSVTFSPDGQTLASAGDDDTIRLWDVATRQPLGPPLTGHTSDVLSVTFSPDGKRLASASADSTIMLWDVSTHQPLGRPLTGHTDWVSSVAFSPDGQTLASSSADKTIILWNVAAGQAIGAPLTGHTDAVLKVAFRPDGEMLASSSADKIIHLWDVKTGQALDPPFIGHTDWVWSLTFSPDGQTLASVGNDKTIILWDVVTRQPLGPPLTGHTDQIWGVAFSPDGQTLASGSRDNTVILWDVATRQPLGPPLTGHTDWVWGVAFSPDGQTLASGSRDSTIILWQVPFEPWLTHACRIANRNLTRAEWGQLIGSEVPYEPTCPNLPPMK